MADTTEPQWGEGLTGEEMKALKGIVPDDTLVRTWQGIARPLVEWTLGNVEPFYHLPANSPVYTVRDRNAKHPDERPWIPHCGDTCPADWDGKAVLLKNGAVCWISAPCWNNSGPQWKVAGYRRLAEPATESEEGVEPVDKAAVSEMTEDRALAELALLYNFKNDDSRQFTRWNMSCAIQCGYSIAKAENDPDHNKAGGLWYRRWRDLFETTPTDTVTLPRMTEAEARVLWARNCAMTSTPKGDFLYILRELGLIRPTPIEALRTAHPGMSDTELCEMLLEQRGEG